MSIPIPAIDDRRFEDLRNELVARIATHTPEWTHRNASDPGITLLELFAFLGESILYRAGNIPERNRRAFLNLLGVRIDPGAPAVGMVKFSRTANAVATLAAGFEVKADELGFRLLRGLDVLPLDGFVCWKERVEATGARAEMYQRLYAARLGKGQSLSLYRPHALDGGGLPFGGSNSVDGSAWVALLANEKPPANGDLEVWRRGRLNSLSGRVLSLGVVPEPVVVSRSVPAVGTTTAETAAGFQVELAAQKDGKLAWIALGTFRGALRQAGAVEVVLPDFAQVKPWQPIEELDKGVGDSPPDLDQAEMAEKLLGWLRLRPLAGAVSTLRWLGINAASIEQGGVVVDDFVGTGNGEPDQSMRTATTPVVPGSLRLSVDGKPWAIVEDLEAAPREGQPGSQVAHVDWQDGTIRFGDGLAGARPPAGVKVRASYRVNDGERGNVPAGRVKTLVRSVPNLTAENPVATWGGTSPQPLAVAERRVASWLRHRDRCITVEDFRELTFQTPSVRLARVDVLPTFHPDISGAQGGDAPGCVTIMVVPPKPASGLPPDPDDRLLSAVCDQLEPKRLVTTELLLRGPKWRRVVVSVGIEVVAQRTGSSVAEVRQAVRDALVAALSPVPERGSAGWQLGRTVRPAELMVVVAQVPGVRAVIDVLLGDTTGAVLSSLPLVGLELPWLANVAVTEGVAAPVTELVPKLAAVSAPSLPVPVLRHECDE